MDRLAQLGRAGLFALLFFLSYFTPQFARAAATPDAANVADLVRRAVANYQARQAQRDHYTYLERVVRTEYGPTGKVKGHITGTYEIMFLRGAPYRRLVRINDQPLSPQLQTLEQQLLEAETKVRQDGGKPQPVRTSFSAPVDQLTEGFQLRKRGKQMLDGREVQIIEALPDDEHRPAGPEQDYARNFRMKLWIDAAEAQIVRVESRVVGERVALEEEGIAFSWNGFSTGPQFSTVKHRVEVARGTVNDMEWTKVNNEAWLPKRSYWKAAKMTVTVSSEQKPLRIPIELTCSFSDYKKFRVDTRIVPE
jgi:hypothetical protein